MGKIIGIDLGTTNSCVAVFEGRSRNLARSFRALVEWNIYYDFFIKHI